MSKLKFLVFENSRFNCNVKAIEKANYTDLSNELVLCNQQILLTLKAIAINEQNPFMLNYWADLNLSLNIYKELLTTQLNTWVNLIPFCHLVKKLPIKENNILIN